MAGSINTNMQEVSSIMHLDLDRSMHELLVGMNIFIYALKSMHIKLALKIHSFKL